MAKMEFTLETLDGKRKVSIDFNSVLAIGFAGRNQEKVLEHIKELEEIGVPAPKSIPEIYCCSENLVTNENNIQVVGNETSGEVEFVIIFENENTYIGLGSDHTDRALETVSIGKSKQICSKPLASELWRYEDVKNHWDELRLLSWQIPADGSEEVLYQDGKLNEILEFDKILSTINNYKENPNNMIVFSGTVPVKDNFIYGKYFRYEIRDEVLNRKISHEYNIETI
jgi:hypothetical protein